MKTYEWILFDADETLFHFDAFAGLQLMFSRFDVQFTAQDYATYQAVNKALWVDYQKGDVTAEHVQYERFSAWGKTLNRSPQDLNSAFLATMAEICAPLEGVISLLRALKGQTKLGIITNGFTKLQEIRLERTGLRDHFDVLVISEEVGYAKPHQGIFDHALAAMGNPPREKVLMVGDTPESDILGGINAGMDTCWLNVDNRPAPVGITPRYQVASMAELECLLLDKPLAMLSK